MKEPTNYREEYSKKIGSNPVIKRRIYLTDENIHSGHAELECPSFVYVEWLESLLHERDEKIEIL